MSKSNPRYGLTALPADQSKTKPITNSPKPVSPEDVPVPSTPLAARINAYVKLKLSPETYRHSLRVYTYGLAIARECFPTFNVTPGSSLEETWFLTAMLHDIGTTEEFISSTALSYEFWAGYHALEILQHPEKMRYETNAVTNLTSDIESSVSPIEQAESVAEAIIRHQDVQDKGNITLITRLIHLGTLLDNIGAGKELVHPETIKLVTERYSRERWSGCFASTVKQEKALKPWAMVSRIEGFEQAIEDNGKSLMDEGISKHEF